MAEENKKKKTKKKKKGLMKKTLLRVTPKGALYGLGAAAIYGLGKGSARSEENKMKAELRKRGIRT